ncbi:MAG TPA: metal-dependent hydrolase, partial [Sphingomonadaceae bacterium]|nr:metal-dependent hydrolase [Sphingomonadaceae bacterium]
RRGTRPEARLPVSFKWLYLLSLIGCLSHPALDWLNVYGIRLLEPFSSQWFYGDTLFIIDIWLWLGLGFATWFSLRRERRGGEWKRPARVALAAMLAYIVVNWHITALNMLVLDDGPGSTIIASPTPIAFWQREMIFGGDGHYRIDGREVGTFDLTREDYPDIISAVPEAEPFLFWARTPYIARDEDGRFFLRDARFAGRGGFQVELPEAVCKPLQPPDLSGLEPEGASGR